MILGGFIDLKFQSLEARVADSYDLVALQMQLAEDFERKDLGFDFSRNYSGLGIYRNIYDQDGIRINRLLLGKYYTIFDIARKLNISIFRARPTIVLNTNFFGWHEPGIKREQQLRSPLSDLHKFIAFTSRALCPTEVHYGHFILFGEESEEYQVYKDFSPLEQNEIQIEIPNTNPRVHQPNLKLVK